MNLCTFSLYILEAISDFKTNFNVNFTSSLMYDFVIKNILWEIKSGLVG